MFAELLDSHFARKMKLRFESASDCQKRFDERLSWLNDVDFYGMLGPIIEVVSEGEYTFVKKVVSFLNWSRSFDHEIGFYKPNLRPEQIALLEKMHRFSR